MALNSGTALQQGKYIIVRHISNGGFGVTYEAKHSLLHKRLAIKEFFVKDFCNRDESTKHVTVGTQSKAQLVNKLKHKFIDEAAALSSFSHPNIVNVSDVFEENGTAYYVMDYIDGKSLHELVNDNGPLTEAVAVDYVIQIAKALQYVHANNRLHLDIKPGNIMVDNSGKAILIDFGASKQYDEVDGVNTSTLLGKTPGYAPIEQMGNRVQTFNPATDVYSLGATLYKLLSGVTPPNATDVADDDSLLKPLPPTISEHVKNAVAKAMEMKRKNRPQSMREFQMLLEGNSKDDENTVVGIEDSSHNATSSTATAIISTATGIKSGKKKYYLAAGGIASAIIIAACLWGHSSPSSTTEETAEAPAEITSDTVFVERMAYKNQGGVLTGYYTGTLVDSIMDGEGEFTFIEGGSAKGLFRNNQIIKGRKTTADNYYFEGTYQDEEPYDGTWFTPEGAEYSIVKNGEEQ